MKITTRTGDKGETSIGDGTRVPKDDPRVSLVGTLDECQANIGMARAIAKDEKKSVAEHLFHIEKSIGLLMGHLTKYEGCECPPIEPLEKLISEVENTQKDFSFLLPGESRLGAAIHLSRAVSRRAERAAAPLIRDGEIGPEATKYLNRLSDYLYALALINERSAVKH